MAEIAVKLAAAAAQQLVLETVGEVSLLVGVREEVEHIVSQLNLMHAFLRDAEKQQASNETARAWVSEVRRLAFDAEDCLDDFSLHLGHRHRGNLLTSFARRVCSLPNWISRHQIASKIQDIKQRVDVLSSTRTCYNRTDDHADADVGIYDPRLSALFVEDSQLVGIDVPRGELVGLLLDETERRLSLIAVVGEGGLGKTTIVKKAYDDPRVTGGHFKCRAWITVSQTPNIEGILKDIIKQVTPSQDTSSMNMVELIQNLNGHLKHVRYMIVFDDIWDVDAWKSLEMALPKNEVGSRIILTARNKDLAESACATPDIHGHIYCHQKLNSEKSTELFLRRAFKNPERTFCPGHLEDLTLAILDKCDGLPLAIILIAGVLASKPNKSREEWEKMNSRLGSELEHNPNLKGMNHIFTLSYNDLPYHVGHCFLYLSKFPEDYVIGRKRIQMLWIAEGFVSGRHDMTAEAVSESYFNELANRFMIIPLTFSTEGKVQSFKVHDIILELIVSRSCKESFLSIVVGNNEDREPITSDVIRRLSVHGTSKHVEKNMNRSHVRSLTIQKGVMLTLISPLFRMIRVMDLQGCDVLENKHIKIVAKLLHLKYLSMRGTRVDELPGCMKRLTKLETLDIRKTNIKKLPEGISKLQELRFLYGMVHDDFRAPLEIPRGIGRLSAMQVLTGIDAKRSGKQVVKELRKMTMLRKLAVRGLPEEMMADFCDSLNAVSDSLRSLLVEGRLLHGLDRLSEPPLQPPLKLESLRLRGGLNELPPWVLHLRSLLKLSLAKSCLTEDAIQSLGDLPNLIQLSLEGAFEGGSLCFGARGFPRLKVLVLTWLPPNPSVGFLGGAMCQLERVSIHGKMGSGRMSGIANLPSLKQLRADRPLNEEWWVDVEAQLLQHPNRDNPPSLFNGIV